MNEPRSMFAIDKTMLKTLVFIGIVSGIVCAFTKLGWEIPFPPRTPARDETNPPQQLLQQVGLSHEMTHKPYTYNENQRAIAPLIMHFGFSITFSILYVLAAEIFPKVTLWQGAFYGIILWAVFHAILLPAMGTVPPPWQQPFAEHLSEIGGHAFCFWTVEITRHDLKNRFFHKPTVETA